MAKKRRNRIDVNKRKKTKDYKDKRTADNERFNDDIKEKTSKLNNFDRDEPAENSRLSSSEKTKKHIKRHMKEGEGENNSSITETSDKKVDSIDYTRNETKAGGSYDLEKEVPKGTDSIDVKSRPKEHRNLDIGERRSSNFVGKRIHEDERFEDSLVKKKSKLQHGETETVNAKGTIRRNGKVETVEISEGKGDTSSVNEAERKRKQKKLKELNGKIRKDKYTASPYQSEVYDPLSKDMDNDGIPDRYDNDFRDSDYEESTYDIDGLHKYDKETQRKTLKKEAVYSYQKKQVNKPEYKKTTEDVNTLKNGVESATLNHEFDVESLSDDAKKLYEKKENKLIQKRKRASKLYDKPKHGKSAKLMGTASGTSFIAAEYMGAGSDENVAVEATEKGLLLNSGVTRYTQNKLQNKRRNPLKDEKKFALKHRKNMAKAEYQTELESLKKNKEFQKRSTYKKIIKKKQMKKRIYEEHNIQTSFKDRVKKQFEDIVKGSSEVIKKSFRRILIAVGIAVILFVGISYISSMFLGGLGMMTTEVMTSTYLSSEDTLADINNDFSSLEYELADELDNIESYHPGYDEYIIRKNGEIGHDIHELLSYITAKYGEVDNASDLSAELKYLYDEMYDVKYETEVETRYRTVCHGSGEDRVCEQEAYDWYIFKVTVTKTELDTVARKEFTGYEDNLAHYETLLESCGNMEEYFGGSGITPVIPDSKIIGELINDPNLTDKQKKLVSAAYSTPTAGRGYCAAWASNVYANAGFRRPGGNACDQYYWYCKSSDLSELKPGMMIAVPSHNGTAAGKKYGHVGIYVGNGIVRENIGYVKDTKLSDWISYYGSSARWGYAF